MSPISYPDPRRQDLTEEIHGRPVADPYRWLEDPRSEETLDWLAAQDALYAEHVMALPGRDALAGRIAELLAAGTVGVPRWRGSRQFFTRRMAGQEHSVLYTASPQEGERVLIDPMAIDASGITTLDSWRPDREGRLVAYLLSAGGSEESVLSIMDIASGEQVDGPIDRCRYSQVAWLPGGKAFYYTRRLAPGLLPAGEEQYHRRVYLHRVGSPADDDVMIFGEGREKTNYYMVSVSVDGRWLAIGSAAGTAPRNDLWLADLTTSGESAPELHVVQQDVDAQTDVHVGRDGRMYIFTDRDAPRGRLAVADPAKPGVAHWQDLIRQDPEAVLTGYAILDGTELSRPVMLTSWTRHAISELAVHDLTTGTRLGTVSLPGLGSITGLSERPEGGHEAWVGYTDHTTPAMVLRFDARTGAIDTWERAPGSAQLHLATRQVAYESRDGTVVRMLIISGGAEHGSGKDGPGESATSGSGGSSSSSSSSSSSGGGGGGSLSADSGPSPGPGGSGSPSADSGPGPSPAPDEPRPTILHGYGGFNVSLTPAYSAAILAWAEAGGVYVIAGLRGGSEEGEDWHRAGMRERKQNVFDDFHAAAQRLICDGWTTRSQLSIWGGSNGGLLVGAAITQRPELYAAAVCSAPLLDMVRYERFGLGETWNDEFGTAADAEELGWLLGYSPYHHVREGTAYPAVLFTVFDSDSRVDPLHARKMCAALQHATSAPVAKRPIMLRRESDVGHGARAVSRSVALSAETLAFAAFHTGLSR